jgi:hypothetical protein
MQPMWEESMGGERKPKVSECQECGTLIADYEGGEKEMKKEWDDQCKKCELNPDDYTCPFDYYSKTFVYCPQFKKLEVVEDKMKPGIYDVWDKDTGDYLGREVWPCGSPEEQAKDEGWIVQFVADSSASPPCPEQPEAPDALAMFNRIMDLCEANNRYVASEVLDDAIQARKDFPEAFEPDKRLEKLIELVEGLLEGVGNPDVSVVRYREREQAVRDFIEELKG